MNIFVKFSLYLTLIFLKYYINLIYYLQLNILFKILKFNFINISKYRLINYLILIKLKAVIFILIFMNIIF